MYTQKMSFVQFASRAIICYFEKKEKSFFANEFKINELYDIKKINEKICFINDKVTKTCINLKYEELKNLISSGVLAVG